MIAKTVNPRDRKLVFIDLETTGLDFEKHEITEVGCLIVNGKTLKVEGKYEEKVKPQHLETASKEAIELTGYSDEAWASAKDLEKVLHKVANLAPNAMLAGWNITFDWLFLEKGFKKYSIKHKYDYHRLDVMSMAYLKLFKSKKLKSLSLRKTAELYGVEVLKIHRAMNDATATYQIFLKLVKK